ncbi:hypothetical protein [Rhizobium leguminosarum]|uniref:hypothetical protein n=1 Tax=Rhizobium leguminosarum TaxID=384 RepID=UPI001030DCDF|nr:hypothetical protein [Rhizobium leguminosarum]TBG92670.1 hypothetical protein ELG73_37920 [Rhizobium leguminosarum]
MSTLGQQWRQQVTADMANLSILEESLARREAQAEAWVREAQLRNLLDGINSCIARNSDSLALPVPSELVTTRALRNFMVSLSDQDLTVDVAIDADGDGESLLMIAPSSR